MSAPKYRIKSIEDFLAVPPDRREDCLGDFAQWLSIAGNANEVNKAMIEMLGLPEDAKPLVTDCFVWVDDGIDGITSIDIVVKEAA